MKDMDNEKWTKRLHDRLADHEESVTDELWAGIEARLAQQEAPRRAARPVPLWGRWAVAATLVGVLAGGGYLAWQGTRSASPLAGGSPVMAEKHPASSAPVAHRPQESVPGHPSSATDGGAPAAEALGRQRQSAARQQSGHPVCLLAEVTGSKQGQAVVTVRQEEKGMPMESEKIEENTAPSASVPAAAAPAGRSAGGDGGEQPAGQNLPQDVQAVLRELDREIAEAEPRERARVGLGLYAANGFGSQSDANGVLMSPSLLDQYDYDRYMSQARSRAAAPVYLAGYEERQKYYRPISFGLTVNIPVSSGFSVVTGLVYTRLRSDFTNVAAGHAHQREQTLYYVGIPLSGHLRLWNWRGLNVYAAAGGQADFNVKARLMATGVEQQMRKDRVQWSLQAAVGLQYDIIPQIGVYAEPGLKYYFDNGSEVRNFFKDKPTALNLQVGLRLNF